MSEGDQDEPYEVGYRKPPRSGQFKKGQSGNPKGRPKGSGRESRSVDETILNELNRLVVVKEGGEPVKLTVLAASVRSLGVAAIKGSPTAQKALLANACNAAVRQASTDAATEEKYEPPSITQFWEDMEEFEEFQRRKRAGEGLVKANAPDGKLDGLS